MHDRNTNLINLEKLKSHKKNAIFNVKFIDILNDWNKTQGVVLTCSPWNFRDESKLEVKPSPINRQYF